MLRSLSLSLSLSVCIHPGHISTDLLGMEIGSCQLFTDDVKFDGIREILLKASGF